MLLTIVRGIGPVLIVLSPCIVMEQTCVLGLCRRVLLSWSGAVWLLHRQLVHPADVKHATTLLRVAAVGCPPAASDLHLCRENSQSQVATLSLKPRTESMDGWP